MRVPKWLSGLVAGAGLMLAASGASAVTIGFAQTGSESDWHTAFSKDMQETAKKMGIELKFSDAQ